MVLRIDRRLCTGCGDCVNVCAVEALSVVDGTLVMQPDECIECAACIDECPFGALSLVDAGAEQTDNLAWPKDTADAERR
jgi:ferredoxin